jgi:hypothetical protein
MINVLSTTDKYILQPSLVGMHRESITWLSATLLWKRELHFFQKLLDQYAPKMKSLALKKQIDHFQSLITYYNGELVDLLHKKLREHENHLARMLKELNEADVVYYQEHKGIIEEVSAFAKSFGELKHELFEAIEKQM